MSRYQSDKLAKRAQQKLHALLKHIALLTDNNF